MEKRVIDKMRRERLDFSGTSAGGTDLRGLHCKLPWNAETLSDKIGKSFPQQKFGLTCCWFSFKQFHLSCHFLVAIQS